MKNFDKIIVIGDVHGCLVELEELLQKVAYKSDKDRLIFLGDLVDRGPKSLEVLKLARSLGAESVVGNHEDKHLTFLDGQSKYLSPYKLEWHRTLDSKDIDYMRSMPDVIELNFLDPLLGSELKFLLVHAGFEPAGDYPTRQPRQVVTRITHVNAEGKQDKRGKFRWPEKWSGPESVIYGHYVHQEAESAVDLSKGGVLLDWGMLDETPRAWCYGLDRGCVFGGSLTAMLFDQEAFRTRGVFQNFVSVPAKQTYWSWNNYRKWGISQKEREENQ